MKYLRKFNTARTEIGFDPSVEDREEQDIHL